MRPPLWLVLLCAVSLGFKTAAMGLMLNNGVWNGIQWSTYIIMCLSIVFWIAALRCKGITVGVGKVNVSKKGIISAIPICTLLILSRVIYLQKDSVLFPSIAGFLNALILLLGLYFGLRLNAKIEEKASE